MAFKSKSNKNEKLVQKKKHWEKKLFSFFICVNFRKIKKKCSLNTKK